MPLYLPKPLEWPRLAGWLDDTNSTELGRRIVERAFRDVGILEVPLGSNMGTRIEAMTKRAGLTPPQYWCAIWVGAVWADCGCQVPRGYPACDSWIPYMSAKPIVGSAILYGLRKKSGLDAHHIGIVVRLAPVMLSIEGNRSFAGTASNNGVACDIGPVMRRDILGYIHPRAATTIMTAKRLPDSDRS